MTYVTNQKTQTSYLHIYRATDLQLQAKVRIP